MTADEMNENGEGWRDLIAQWYCVPIPMLSPRLFVIIVHVVNIVRNNGGTKPQQRRKQTAMAEKPKPPGNIMKPLTITHIIR